MRLSCVMLTTARRARLRAAALAAYAQQHDPGAEVELVIASEDAVTGPLPPTARVVATAPGLTLAQKRNAAVAHAVGDWVTFWDDDDYSGPFRLDQAVRATRANPDLFGQAAIWFHELTTARRYTYRYTYQGPEPYLVGGLLGFRRDLWEAHPFIDQATVGDEGWWTLDRLRAGARVEPTLIAYVAMLHGGNVSNRELPRVDEASKRVLSDSFWAWKGARDTAQLLLGPAMLAAFEEAVAEKSNGPG